MKVKSITRKVALSYFIVGVIIILLLAIGLSIFSRFLYLQNTRSHLLNTSKLLAASVEVYFEEPSNIEKLDAYANEAGKGMDERITIVDKFGKVLGDSQEEISRMENHKDRPEIRQAFKGHNGFSTRWSGTLEQEMMYVAVPIEVNNEIVGALRISLPLASINQSLYQIWLIILILAIVSGLIAIAMSWVLGHRITDPLTRMIDMTRKVGQGDLDQHLLIDSRDEIQELAENLNWMTTRLKEQILEAQEQQTKLRNMLADIADGVVVTNAEGRIELLNTKAEKLFEIDAENAHGRSIIEITQSYRLQDMIQNSLKGKHLQEELEISFPRKKILKVKTSPLKTVEGIVFGTITSLDDVSKIRRLEKARRDFTANISHELRTPISSIKALVESLLAGAKDEPEKARDFLERIEKETDRLTMLINDILDLSRLETAQITKKESVDLKELTVQAIERIQAQAVKKNISVELSDSPDEFKILGEKDQILLALSNLLDNAIKYTSPGGNVSISFAAGEKNASIIVKDSGIGIPQKDIPRIFERFYVVDRARSRESGGTGLGLSIVKHVVENHNGRVKVESVLGEGSIFTISLPKS